MSLLKGYRRGFSLVEGIIAVAMLVTALVVFYRILHVGLGYRARSENRAIAATVGRKVLAEIRLWARKPGNFDDWTPYTGVSFQDPDEPRFKVDVTSQDEIIGSPETESESQHLAFEQRFMSGVFRRVQVTVNWRDVTGKAHLNLVTLVADGRRAWRVANPIDVTGIPPVSLARDGTVNFTAKAFDNTGRELHGLFYVWSVEAIDGNGSVLQNRSGSSVTFTNKYRFVDGNWGYTGGSCRVMATAMYRGEERQGFSAVVNLTP